MARRKSRQKPLTLSQIILGFVLFVILMVALYFYLDFAWNNTMEKSKLFEIGN